MKSKIIIFISLIAYILSDVSILSVATGACKDKKYTFVIKANSNADLAAGSATVKLASPESTTPTCTFEAVSTTSSGGGSSSGDSGSSTGGGSSSGDSGSTTGGGSSSGDSGSTTGGRRLATGDFDITCVITSKLDNADIKVQSVAITSVTVSAATGVTYPLSINEKATCEGTASSDPSTPDGDKFIQISGFLFLLILIVF